MGSIRLPPAPVLPEPNRGRASKANDIASRPVVTSAAELAVRRGQTGQFNVFGPVSKFGFGIQTPVTAGTPFTVRVYAEDSAGNVISGYSGSPTWGEVSSGLSGSPNPFSGGVSTNTVTLPHPYSRDRITATDGSVTSTTGPFNVS